MKKTGKVNRILTAILILGTVTVFFPLYGIPIKLESG